MNHLIKQILCSLAVLFLFGCYNTERTLQTAERNTLEARKRYAQEKGEENMSRARLDYFRQKNDTNAIYRESIIHQKHSKKLISTEQKIRILQTEEDTIRAHCCLP